MKLYKKIITLCVILFVIAVTTVPAFALVSNELIDIPSNQVWTRARTDLHDHNYSYTAAKCHSVYPTSGTDNFKRIQCRIVEQNGILIMDHPYVVLIEGRDFQDIKIKEGYIGAHSVGFQFRGNTDSAAKAVVSYEGTYIKP